MRGLFATKSLEALQEQSEKSELKRTLGAFDLVMLGIGCILGTGIFVITGTAAYKYAGPAVALSFVISGCAAATAAFSYAEMASMIPIAGSAYTYAYASFGEIIAWLVGWTLILEYLVGAATVAVGWSGYTTAFVKHLFGIKNDPEMLVRFTQAALVFDDKTHSFKVNPMGGINLPAMFITLLITFILIFGIKESAKFNMVAVFCKMTAILVFIVALIPKIDTKNWHPFIPPNEGTFSRFGFTGVLTASTTVFFAYIGFDAVSTTAQEAKKPQRDLPIGILGSLAICTILYLAVCFVMTGVMNYKLLSGAHPLSQVVSSVGWVWLSIIVEIGAIAGLTSVMLINLMGQPRIFFAMAHDGLFPQFAAKIHPKYKTPWVTTLLTGAVCATFAGVLPIDVLAEMSSVGTLFAFVLVNIGVIILRVKRPDAPRRFSIPGGAWVIPPLGALLSTMLVFTATTASLMRLGIWMAIGVFVYCVYGMWNSKLRYPHKHADYKHDKKTSIEF